MRSQKKKREGEREGDNGGVTVGGARSLWFRAVLSFLQIVMILVGVEHCTESFDFQEVCKAVAFEFEPIDHKAAR